MLSVLQNILGEKQGEVYLASLKLGTATVAQIAKAANLPRSTCYLLLEELETKGLISKTSVGKKTLIIAEKPNKVLEFSEKQNEILSENIKILSQRTPELEAIYNKAPQKPTVRFYEGFEGVKTILEETLNAKEILVLCSGYNDSPDTKLLAYLDNYFEKVDKNKIKTFEILGCAPDTQQYIDKYQSDLHQLKFDKVNSKERSTLSHVDKMIFDNKVAIVSYEYLNGLVIENQQIADFEREQFFKIWQNT